MSVLIIRNVTLIKSQKGNIQEIVIRIDDIPTNNTHDVVRSDLDSLIQADPKLKEDVISTVHHFHARRDKNIFCATVTVHMSASTNDVVRRLGLAGAALPYHFDSDFDGITPLYECPDGADVE